MNKLILFCLLLVYQEVKTDASSGPISTFIRANFIGFPVIHEKQSWAFDPDVSVKRRSQFRQLHGERGEKLIERLGLGIDGMDQERLEQQRKRDEGHLGGLNFYLP